MWLSKKELWRSLVSNGVDPLDMEEWKNFEMFFTSRKSASLDRKGSDGVEQGKGDSEGRDLDAEARDGSSLRGRQIGDAAPEG